MTLVGLILIPIGLVLNNVGGLVTMVASNAAVAQTNSGGAEYQANRMLATAPYETMGVVCLIFATIFCIAGLGNTKKSG